MPYVEDLLEFRDRMACEAIYVREHGAFLFANGARSYGGVRHVEPPHDPAELLSVQIEFLQAKLVQQESLRQQCDAYIVTQSDFHSLGAGPLPVPTAFDDLEQFQKTISELRELIGQKQTELAVLRGPSPRDAYLQRVATQRQAASQAIERARAIGV